MKTTCFFLALFLLSAASLHAEEIISLNGKWSFRLSEPPLEFQPSWFEADLERASEWTAVIVPHTWQTESPDTLDKAAGWYSRSLPPLENFEGQTILLEFDAVYRDADIYLNNEKVGEHYGSGWTPFSIDITNAWKPNGENRVFVKAANHFSEQALPYKDSFDWANDGGIIRDVRLHVLPKRSIEHALIDVSLSSDFSQAVIKPRFQMRGPAADNQTIRFSIANPKGQIIHRGKIEDAVQSEAAFTFTERDPILWHFDHPNLYRIDVELLQDGNVAQTIQETFGVRKVEVRDGFYWLNGEPMRLMGLEWMPGSDPRHGMAEPEWLMREVLEDMKRLNCVISRFHWQQDDFIFEFSDRNGFLLQEEVPAWGPKTRQGSLDAIQEIHTREMILPHCNHPSIYAWGLCNEIGEKQPEVHHFINRGAKLARALDPHRLLTHASNAFQDKDIADQPEQYASRALDFLEWNDYYESWYGGTVQDAEANLARLAKAFPDHSLVISEYGLCECNPKNPSGDERRIEILKTHTDAYRRAPNVAGAIFFSYNDYRTHIGDKGTGAFQQRVHGVVDLLNRRKPSWDALRREMSPIRDMAVIAPQAAKDGMVQAVVLIEPRSLENNFPAYIMRGYELIWTAYNDLGQPMGTGKQTLTLHPGESQRVKIEWAQFDDLARVQAELFRPTGYSVHEAEWE